jgi:translation initiation factor 1
MPSQPLAGYICKTKAGVPGDGKVRVSRETRGRGGKSVTLVKGLALDAARAGRAGQAVAQPLTKHGIETKRAGG